MDATAQFIFAVLQTALFSSVVIICFSCCCEKKKGRPSHYQGSYEGNVQSLQPYAQSVPGSATTPPISNSCYQPTPFQQPPRVMRSMKSQRNNQTRPHPPPFPAASSQPGGPYPPPSPLMRPAMPAVNSPIGAAYPPPMHPTSPLFDPMPYPNSQPMSPAAGRGAGWNPQAFQPQAQPPILVGPPAFGGPSPYGMPPPLSATGGLTASQRLAKINMTPAVVHPAPPSARHARSARSLSSKRDSSKKSGKGSSKSTTGTGGDSQRTSSSSKSEADRRNQRRRSADRRKK